MKIAVEDIAVEKLKPYPNNEDVKGKKTAMYQLKKKMFERRYPDWTITEVEM